MRVDENRRELSMKRERDLDFSLMTIIEFSSSLVYQNSQMIKILVLMAILIIIA
jgi:hypothetical protein